MREDAFEVKVERFALHYDEDKARAAAYRLALDELVIEMYQLKEGALVCFREVNDNAGVIDIVLTNEVPIREVATWRNRVEQMFERHLTRLLTCPTCGTRMKPAGNFYVCEECGYAT